MGFIRNIINKIKNFFRPRLVAGQEEIVENKAENNINQSSSVYRENRKEFFRIYKDYKDGKIKEEDLLITDLIDIELMMLEEKSILEEKIEKEEKKIGEQINLIKELNYKKSNLEKIT